MPKSPLPPRTSARLPTRLPARAERNNALYRSLTRTLREYNRRLVAAVRERGFADLQPSFPTLLSNLDLAGTPIGVLAKRGGVSRQAAGQLLREIEGCGFATRRTSTEDARTTIVEFTPLGRLLLATVIEVVIEIEQDFARMLPHGNFAVMRDSLHAIADNIDPDGAFGAGDLPEKRTRR